MTFPWWAYSALAALAAVELLTRGGLIRRVLREVVRGLGFVEHAANALVRWVVGPRYLLVGACHQCGACCRQIVAAPPAWIARTRLVKLFLAYHYWAHRFSLVGKGPEGELVLACGHLGQDGTCGIYAYRPTFCREYPRRPLYTPPRPMPCCGFRVVAQSVLALENGVLVEIVNPFVGVHHPTPAAGPMSAEEEVDWVEDVPSGNGSSS